MVTGRASQKRFEDAVEFFRSHPGTDDLSLRHLALHQTIHEHFHNRAFERAFFGLIEEFVVAQLEQHPMPTAKLRLRTFGG